MIHEAPEILTLVVDAQAKQDAMDAIFAHLVEEGALPLDAVAEIQATIARRETLGSTAIGGGVAFPSARHDCVARPLLAVALLKRPNEDWDSLDMMPVDVVFLVIAPHGDVRLCRRFFDSLMGSLARGFGDRVRQAASAEAMALLFESLEPD